MFTNRFEMLINVNLVDLTMPLPPPKGVSKKVLQILWVFLKNTLGYGYKCNRCQRQGRMNYYGGGSYPIIGFFCDDCDVGWSLEFLKDDRYKKRLQYITRSLADH